MIKKFSDRKSGSSTDKPLVDKYVEEQGLGTLQTRGHNYEMAIAALSGGLLIAACSLPGRHTAQLAKGMIREKIGFIRSYLHDPMKNVGALPRFGKATELGAQTVIVEPFLSQGYQIKS